MKATLIPNTALMRSGRMSAAQPNASARPPATTRPSVVARYSRLVALPHTIFALPFAVGAAALAWKHGAVPFSPARLGLIIVAVALDVVYQLLVLQWIYPVETLIVATMLALVPCMVVRAIGNRIVTVIRQRRLRHMKQVSPDHSRGASDNSRATDRHDLTHQ